MPNDKQQPLRDLKIPQRLFYIIAVRRTAQFAELHSLFPIPRHDRHNIFRPQILLRQSQQLVGRGAAYACETAARLRVVEPAQKILRRDVGYSERPV